MAQRVQLVLTCDLDGDEDVPAVETVRFAYNGSEYEFELCEAHLGEFHELMEGYASAARHPSGRRRRRSAAAPTRRRGASSGGDEPSTGEIREWAKKNGYQVSDRGRIAADVRAAYDAAN